MELYIRTRGDNLDQGYRWVRVTEDGQQESLEPPITRLPEANDLIYGEDFSVLLVWSEQQLVLQVTGLPVTERSQRTRRNVQNILVCVAQPDEERILRGIAVSALRDDRPLATILDEHVVADLESPLGFRVLSDLPERLLCMRAQGMQEGIAGDERIGTDIDQYRKMLVAELDTFTLPEKRAGTLVAVTRHRSHDVLKRAKVWRGLSDMPEPVAPAPSATSANGSPSLGTVIIVIAVVIVVGLAGLVLIILP
jgi:hypothetical protein